MKLSLIAVLLIFLMACASSRVPTQVDVDRVQKKFPDYSLVELNHGKKLYEQHCGSCHGLKKPASRSEEQWRRIVPAMVKKVNKKSGSVVLDPNAENQVLKYVVTMRIASENK